MRFECNSIYLFVELNRFGYKVVCGIILFYGNVCLLVLVVYLLLLSYVVPY